MLCLESVLLCEYTLFAKDKVKSDFFKNHLEFVLQSKGTLEATVKICTNTLVKAFLTATVISFRVPEN